MNKLLEVFSDCTDTQMLEIYKDILGSNIIGIRAKSLDVYAEKLKEICQFETKAQAISLAEKLFSEETSKRFYAQMK